VTALFNRDRARRVLAQRGLAAVVATRPENVLYLSGFGGVLYPLAGTPAWSGALFCADAQPSMVAVSAGALLPLAEEPGWADEVVGVGRDSLAPPEGMAGDPLSRRLAGIQQRPDGPEDVMVALARGLKTRGLAGERVGWDDPAYGRDVAGRFGLGGQVLPAAEVLREIRAVKTPAEIARLTAALEANEVSFRAVFDAPIEGAMWTDLVARYRLAFVGRGARALYEAGGIGPRSVATFADGGGPARPGEPIFFDAGGTLDRYWTDTGRTVFVGEPAARQRLVLEAEVAGLEAVCATARPGVPAAALVSAFRQVVVERGLPDGGWFWGHGVGLELYEWPRVRESSSDVLEEGMVFNFESPYRAVGLGGVHLEQTFLVTEDACRSLSRLPGWLVTARR
jgi:Xaa-Pro aminopeptidase